MLRLRDLLFALISFTVIQKQVAGCGSEANHVWSEWLSVDVPSIGLGDYETRDNLFRAFGSKFCPTPSDLEAQSIEGQVPPDLGNKVKFTLNLAEGFICNGNDCEDYQVRLCCQKGTEQIPSNVDVSKDGCLLENVLADGILNEAAQVSCVSPCDEDGAQAIVKEQDCNEVSYCTWKNNFCHKKLFKETPPVKNGQDNFLSDFKEVVEGRNFNILGGPYPPPGVPNPGPYPPGFPLPFPQAPTFPDNCNINAQNPNIWTLLQPPFDIPYCFRISCSPNDPSLELNRFACHSRPGCYFDVELSQMRAKLGSGILPGVPVCHLVIRHKRFAEKAQKAVAAVAKQWNGLYTNCFLQQNPSLFDDNCCGGLSVLQYFGAYSKQLGWEGMTMTTCKMLGGCFQGVTCYYPPDYTQIKVRSGSDPYRNINAPIGRDIYGQQPCLPLDITGSAESVLTSYHNCRRAGCVVDPSIDAAKLQALLCEIAKSNLVPVNVKNAFWNGVQNGECRADNWKECLERFKNTQQCSPSPYNPLFNLGRKKRQVTQGFLYLPGCTNVFGLAPSSPAGNPFLDLLRQPTPSSPYGNPFLQIPNLFEPPCPYRQYSYLGASPLQGSFAGCCKKQYCYIPRVSVRSQSSGVAAYHGPWKKWSDCSQSCGTGGTRKRSRDCIQKFGEECYGETEQTEVCNEFACPYWGNYSNWGGCSAKCGGGLETRSRNCLPDGKGCTGSESQSRECNTGPCPTYGAWSAWSRCAVGAGSRGKRSRTRVCTDSPTFPCSILNHPLFEEVDCVVYCAAKPVYNQRCVGILGSCMQITHTCTCPDCNPRFPRTVPCTDPDCPAPYVKKKLCYNTSTGTCQYRG